MTRCIFFNQIYSKLQYWEMMKKKRKYNIEEEKKDYILAT